jgi:Thioesterase-like superfamily
VAGPAALPDAEAIYVRDGTRFVPTGRARGPWDPEAQHGGAPAALLATALEQADGGEGLRVARVTCELLRPVPLAPLELAVRVLRPGRRVQLVEAELRHGPDPVARATGLRIREAPGSTPLAEPPPAPGPPRLPDPQGASSPPGTRGASFGSDGMEIRFAAGHWGEPGPATAWMRLRVALIAGEPTTPLARAAAAADFGNGLSAALPWAGWLFINPDLTLYLDRAPAGEWVAVAARTTIRTDGSGLTDSALHDERGPIGRALQALYVAPRG